MASEPGHFPAHDPCGWRNTLISQSLSLLGAAGGGPGGPGIGHECGHSAFSAQAAQEHSSLSQQPVCSVNRAELCSAPQGAPGPDRRRGALSSMGGERGLGPELEEHSQAASSFWGVMTAHAAVHRCLGGPVGHGSTCHCFAKGSPLNPAKRGNPGWTELGL